MKLMGMKNGLYWLAWMAKFTALMLISVCVMTFLFHVQSNFKTAIITHTDPSVTFVFLLLYSISVITFCFAVSTFFTRGKRTIQSDLQKLDNNI